MTSDEREQHMRRMLKHGEKVQADFRRTNEEFERDCRNFWKWIQSAQVRDLFKV